VNWFHALILGVVQGLTELLPISSSAHLILVPAIFKWQKSPLAFDIALHLGTTLAIILFFWRDLYSIFMESVKGILRMDGYEEENFKLGINIIISCIPAGIIALFFKDEIENYFRNPLVSGINLVLFAFFLMYSDRVSKNFRTLGDMGIKDSIFIGILQAIALIPGVSRSGITISAGLLRKFKREDAARFSFIMIVPLVLGGTLLESYEFYRELLLKNEITFFYRNLLFPFVVGTITSFLVGVFALKFLFNYIKRSNFDIFVYYRVIFGIFFLIYFLGFYG